MKANIKQLFILILLVEILFFAENCQAVDDLALAIKTNQSVYKIGDEIVIDFVITNQSQEDIQIYFIDIYEGKEYLSIKKLNGDKVPVRSDRVYKWENPSFHLIKAGGEFKSSFKARFQYQKLVFHDVTYDLSGLDKIRIVGVLKCHGKVALRYQEKYPQRITKDFWIGEIKSAPILIKIK